MTSSNPVAKAIVFDIRHANERDPLFLSASQSLYETTLLAFASRSPQLTSLSVAVVGLKGFDVLASCVPVHQLDFSFNKNAIYPHRGSFSFFLSEVLLQYEEREMNGIDRPNNLHLHILTKSDKGKLAEDISVSLQKSAGSFLGINLSVEVIFMHPSPMYQSLLEEDTLYGEKINWKMLMQEAEIENYFKDWLKINREGWRLELSESSDWSVIIDIEDVMIDLSSWPHTENPSGAATSGNPIGIFSSLEARCLQIYEHVRSDGLPAFYLYGIGRYLFPARNLPPEISQEENQSRFYTLAKYLSNDSYVALARLLPQGRGADQFAIMSSSDGKKLLMRSVVPREFILPFPDQIGLTDENAESEQSSSDLCYSEILESVESVPQLDELPSEKGAITRAIAKKLQDEALFTLGSKKAVAPMKMRKPNLKF